MFHYLLQKIILQEALKEAKKWHDNPHLNDSQEIDNDNENENENDESDGEDEDDDDDDDGEKESESEKTEEQDSAEIPVINLEENDDGMF